MPQSKTKPVISRSRIENIIRIPYSIKQIEVDRDGETELIYTYNEYKHPDDGHALDDADYIIPIVTTLIRAEANTQIEDVAGYPQWFQNNVANGLYPSATGDAMTAYIALVITESNRCEDLVEAAETLDDALEVEPTWPTP